MTYTITAVLMSAIALLSPALISDTEPSESMLVAPATTEEQENVWKYPELKRICACESMGEPNAEPRQYNADGSVLVGVVNSDDKGSCQINAYYHQEQATSLGMDIYTEEGNIAYAHWLYEKEGSQPWLWSKHCWNKQM